jgi:hypothetical protein
MKHFSLTPTQNFSLVKNFSTTKDLMTSNFIDQPLTDDLSSLLENAPEEENNEWFNESPF